MSPMTAMGKRCCQVCDEVGFSFLTDGVDQLIADLPDTAGLGFDFLTCETRVDQASTREVLRVVHVDHLRQWTRFGTDAAGVGEQFGIPLGCDDGVVGSRPR